ncbi:tetratricopeptide repeat protein [Marinobacter sp. OP 3.4]|uniref:tetratricopeptide repeat protein n=1 Tax=Marinobacter sp. OP 3.4 TaxID=3076501 RepID=UPI002E1BB6A7
MYSRNKLPSGTRQAGPLAGLVLAAGLMMSGTALALPAEHEIQRLMLAVEESVEARQWDQAAEYLNRLQRLEGQKPPEYLYYRGQVMAQSGHYNEAMSALENYVAGTGADGKYYTESLKLITDIEQDRSGQAGSASAGDAGQEPVAEITPAGQSLGSGQSAASGDVSRPALVGRMNRIFDQAGWRRDPRLIREGSKPDVHYQASVHDGEIQFRESRNDEDGGRKLTTLILPVYGISPLVEWSCENATESCWIYDPRDGSRLLRLGSDRDQAEALADTLSGLIRQMQKPSGNS